MGYFTEYKERRGKCEYCVNHHGGYSGCHECYGFNFKDKLDLLTYIRRRVNEDASKRFDNSDEGKSLLNIVEETNTAYNDAKDKYDKAKDEYIKSELKKVEDMLDVSV